VTAAESVAHTVGVGGGRTTGGPAAWNATRCNTVCNTLQRCNKAGRDRRRADHRQQRLETPPARQLSAAQRSLQRRLCCRTAGRSTYIHWAAANTTSTGSVCGKDAASTRQGPERTRLPRVRARQGSGCAAGRAVSGGRTLSTNSPLVLYSWYLVSRWALEPSEPRALCQKAEVADAKRSPHCSTQEAPE
jgi:hypothetical protein